MIRFRKSKLAKPASWQTGSEVIEKNAQTKNGKHPQHPFQPNFKNSKIFFKLIKTKKNA